MLIIGERINSTRKAIEEAITKKDSEFIQKEAIEQINSGADMLDVNCGTTKEEPENMKWLVKTIQQVTDKPLVIDSPDPAVIATGLEVHKGKAMINSITLEEERIKEILPLAKKFNSSIIALTIEKGRMPSTSDERVEIAKKIKEEILKFGIPLDEVYFDPLVRSLSAEQKQGIEFLNSLRVLKSLGLKTICGVSNISFGLPMRSLINLTFLAMACYCGLDAAIIDPLDKRMISTIRATDVIVGKDEFCLRYIEDFREGKLT